MSFISSFARRYFGLEGTEVRMGRGRRIAVWLGSYLTAGTILLVYFHVPLFPILAAGVATFLYALASSR